MRVTRSYTLEQRNKACLYWFVYRSWGKVSRKMKIPPTTIRTWAKQSWWQDLIEDIRKRYLAKQDAVYTQILDQAGANVLKQLRKGVLKQRVTIKGEVIEYREEVSLRDQINAIKEVTHALALQRGEATSRS